MLSRQVKERLGDGRQRGGQQWGSVGSPPFGVGRRAGYGRTGPIVANRLSGSGRPSDVAMVEATDFANRDDPAEFRPLNSPAVRRILVEREVSTRPVVVREVASQGTAQVSFAEDEDVIQTFAPDGADKPLREGVLPWAVRRRQDFTDAHALHALPEPVPVDRVAIAEEVGRRGVVREGVHDLLGGPVGSRVFGHVEVDDAPAMVNEHDENEEDAQARGGNREEVEGDQVADMVGEKRPPRLRRPGTPLRHQPGDGALGDVDTELPKLAMDSWGAPEGVRGGHAGDQSLDLGMDGRATSGRAARELAPVLAEAAPLPPQDGVGGNDHERLPPPGPDSSQPDPEEAIRRAQLGSGRRSFVYSQLLPQGKVLDRELAVAAEEEREESKHVEQEGDHRAEILS